MRTDLSGTIVQPRGRKPNLVALIGEAPGIQEARMGAPFVGRSGQEQEAYLTRFGVSARTWYVDNVIREFTEGNPDPTPGQIAEWSPVLEEALIECAPKLIVAVGRFAARWFLGAGVEMETIHGIPHRPGAFDPRIAHRGQGACIMPIYHPASGMHNSDLLGIIAWDYEQVARVYKLIAAKAEDRIPYPKDEYAGKEKYLDVSGAYVAEYLAKRPGAVIGLDTEGYVNAPWSIQISCEMGMGLVLRRERSDVMLGINALQRAADSGTEFVLHNAMHDIEVCRVMGLELRGAKLFDTMYASYLTRLNPQGLKSLAYRLHGVRMVDYADTVGLAAREKQLDYLWDVATGDWPKPETQLVTDNAGVSKLYTPQPIKNRATALIAKATSKEPFDLYAAWKDQDPIQRKIVAEKLGPMPYPTLADLPLADAVRYSARDSDVTLRTYHWMKAELKRLKLEELMAHGMELLPVFEEMQYTGLHTTASYFRDLIERIEEEMVRIRVRLSKDYYGGKPFNPASQDQVAAIMRRQGIDSGKRTDAGKMSTARKAIAHLKEEYDAIGKVIEWRERQKIRDAFCVPILAAIPEGKEEPHAVRCRIKTTRVHTRRLASADPNFLAMPARSELGTEVRKGFVAPPGQVFGGWDLCLAPETKVLTSDLRWVPISSIKRGDSLIGVDEHQQKVLSKSGRVLGRPRKLRTSLVESTRRLKRPSYRITTSDGRKIIASAEHPWLVRNKGKHRKISEWDWKQTSDIKVGDQLSKLIEPWEPDTSYDAGWLAGLFDGEGSFAREDGTITLTQSEGAVLSKAIQSLSSRGYDFHAPHKRADTSIPKSGGFPGSKKNVYQLWMCGMLDCMHFIGRIRPERFMSNLTALWEGKELRFSNGGKQSPNDYTPVTVTSIRSVGERDVVSIQTSTKTFVAEGFITHNSQIELRLLAHTSGDETMCQRFADGVDLHTYTAAQVFNISIDEVDKMLHRNPTKNALFGIAYGISGAGLFDQFQMMGAKGWSVEKCDKLIESIYDTYPGLRAYKERAKKQLRRDGVARDIWGMMRYLPGVWSDDRKTRAEAERTVVSHEIQGGAQGMIQNSMRWLKPRIAEMRALGMNVNWVLQIHDELIFRFDEELWPIMDSLVRRALTRHHGLPNPRVPIQASGNMGKSWGELK